MSFEITEREIEGITILDLHGRLVLGQPSSLLQEAVSALLNKRINCVIFNLQNVPTVDSTGLGLLVSAQTSFQNAAGGLKLLKVQERHLHLLVLTKLTTFFQIFDEERAAIDSFFPDRRPRTFDILEFVKTESKNAPEFDRKDNDTEKSKP